MAKTKKIKLTKGYSATVDAEDFERVNLYKCHIKIRPHCCYAARTRYIKSIKKNRYVGMHRFILGIEDRRVFVDHIDHNGLNNSRKNLRLCTLSQNQQNSRKVKNRSSIYKGVTMFKRTNKFYARITHNKKLMYLGTNFTNEIDAAFAYDDAARRLFSQYAALNFPLSLNRGNAMRLVSASERPFRVIFEKVTTGQVRNYLCRFEGFANNGSHLVVKILPKRQYRRIRVDSIKAVKIGKKTYRIIQKVVDTKTNAILPYGKKTPQKSEAG